MINDNYPNPIIEVTVVTLCYLPSIFPAKLKSVREVLCVSGPDLQRLTGLSRSDVKQLLIVAANTCRRQPPTPGECINVLVGCLRVTSRLVLTCFLFLQ